MRYVPQLEQLHAFLQQEEVACPQAATEAAGLPEGQGLAEAQRAIETLRADLAGCGEATPLFGQDNRQVLAGILGAIEQTFSPMATNALAPCCSLRSCWETANVLIQAERRGRITAAAIAPSSGCWSRCRSASSRPAPPPCGTTPSPAGIWLCRPPRGTKACRSCPHEGPFRWNPCNQKHLLEAWLPLKTPCRRRPGGRARHARGPGRCGPRVQGLEPHHASRATASPAACGSCPNRLSSRWSCVISRVLRASASAR